MSMHTARVVSILSFLLSLCYLFPSYQCFHPASRIPSLLSRQCTTSLSVGETLFDEEIRLLRLAGLSKNVPKDEVKQSIQSLEEKGSTTTSQSLRGKFELIYSSLIPSGYFPVTETADFYGYSLTSRFGPISLGGFFGDYEVMSETNPSIIRFTTTTAKFGPLTLKLKGKERSYTFLYSDKDIAVARSSTGGLTLMKRLPAEI